MSIKRWLTQIVASALGMGAALAIFMYRHAIGHGIAFGIPWKSIGIGCLVIVGLVVAAAAFAGIMYLTRGWALAGLAILVIVGIAQGVSQPDMYRGYASRTVTITKPETVEKICSSLRPTWSVKDCADRVRDENRVLGKDGQPLMGDRLFIDKSIGKKHNGDDRNDSVEYQKVNTTIGVSGHFKSLAAACNQLRPTWKIKYCAKKVNDENPQLRPDITLWRVTIPSAL